MSLSGIGNSFNHWNAKEAKDFLARRGFNTTKMTGRQAIKIASDINWNLARNLEPLTNNQYLELI
jgi:hypothetical protein